MKEIYEFIKEDEFAVTEIMGTKFGFKKWTWGEHNATTASCAKFNPISGEASIDLQAFNEDLVKKTVFYKNEEGKFVPFTTEEIKTMDSQLGERLFQITAKLNLVGSVDTKNL